jgi:hypothetical protein
MNYLNVKSLTFSFAVTYGLSLLFLGWAGSFGWGKPIVKLFSEFYVGFSPSFVGGIIGAIWGFVIGAIMGALIAFFYNMCSKACKACKAKGK